MHGGRLGGNLERLDVLTVSDQIDEMLGLKTWAIVGLSNNSERAAYRVAKVLIENGHQVIPVHPKAESVHGQIGYAKLSDIPVPVDVVDIFVNSSLAGAVVNEAIGIGAKGVWLQLDVIDAGAVARAHDSGLLAVMNHCPAIEYKKRA
jgi:predicted CoA-binding protein